MSVRHEADGDEDYQAEGPEEETEGGFCQQGALSVVVMRWQRCDGVQGGSDGGVLVSGVCSRTSVRSTCRWNRVR